MPITRAQVATTTHTTTPTHTPSNHSTELSTVDKVTTARISDRLDVLTLLDHLNTAASSTVNKVDNTATTTRLTHKASLATTEGITSLKTRSMAASNMARLQRRTTAHRMTPSLPTKRTKTRWRQEANSPILQHQDSSSTSSIRQKRHSGRPRITTGRDSRRIPMRQITIRVRHP